MVNVLLLSKGLADCCRPISDITDTTLRDSSWEGDLNALGPWNPLDAQGAANLPDGILAAANPPATESLVYACGEATSAFDVAWELVRQDMLPDFGSVVTASQTRGRGQMRRPWTSPPGNLYVVLRWPQPRDVGPLVTITAGLALLRALRPALPDPGQLKWPNDILYRGSKVAGILAEERNGVLCVGMGLNLRHAPPKSALRDGWAVPAGTLPPLAALQKGTSCGPLRIWAALVPRIRAAHEYLYGLDVSGMVQEAQLALAGRGRAVELVDSGGEKISGRVMGLAEDGGLRLLTPQGENVFHSGSVRFLPHS